MDFFQGIQFVGAGRFPTHRAVCQRQFPDYYGLQYSQDGAFRVEMGGQFKRTVNGAWVLITRPGPVFRYGAPSGGERLHAFVCFKGPRVNTYIKTGLLPVDRENPLVRITRPDRFYATLGRLIDMLHPMTAAYHARAVNLLENALLQLHEQPADAVVFPEYLRGKFEKLTAAIGAQPARAWDFADVIGDMHISQPHFRRLFRRHAGMAPGKYLMLARLRRAAEQLAGTDQQLKTIAEGTGFADSLYFSRMFKKHYQISPRMYRREFGR